MQPSKSSWSLRLRKILIFILILSVSSCACGPKKGGKGKQGGNEQVYIMLIHGIGHTNQENGELKSGLTYVIDPLKKALEDGQGGNGDTKDDQDGKKKSRVDVFAPARSNSITAPIKTQAEDMFKVIQDKGITPNDKLVIMGHSQGGAVAMTLYAMYMRDWKNLAIVSVQGALCGTPAVDIQGIPQEVTDKVTKIIDYLRDDNNLNKLVQSITIGGISVSHMLARSGVNLNEQIKQNLPQNQEIEKVIEDWLKFTTGPGGKDLSPSGKFMQDLKQAMPKPIPIPVLLVAGEVKNFTKCMAEQVLDSTISRSIGTNPLLKGLIPAIQAGVIQAVVKDVGLSDLISILKSDWNNLVASGQPNDLLIPVSSQWGQGLIQGDKVRGQTNAFTDYVHTESLLGQSRFDEEVKFIKDFINNKN